jgi:replicative DNA helicase
MMDDRLLPSDPQAEEAVLGSILIDADRFAAVREITGAEDFYRETHAIVWRAMEEIWILGDALDQVTVGNVIRSQDPKNPLGGLLAHLVGTTPTSVHATHYARIVRNHARRRRLIAEAGKIVESAYDASSDLDKTAARMIESGLLVAQEGKRRTVLRPILDFANEAFNDIHETFDRGHTEVGITTGLGFLDNYVGGLQGGRLYTVGARTSMGKTALLVQIAKTIAARGSRVAYYSLEETAEELIGRMISIELGFDWTRLDEAGRVAHRNSFADAYAAVSELPIWTTDAARLTTGEMHAQAIILEAQDRGGIDAMFVDYIHLAADSSGRRDNRVEILDRITRNLKVTARELDIPVLAAAQLRRPEGFGMLKEPTLTDLRESGGIEQNSDVVMLLWRPWYYVERGMAEASQVKPKDWQGTPESIKRLMKVIVAKNKHGPTGSFPMFYATESGRIGGWQDA